MTTRPATHPNRRPKKTFPAWFLFLIFLVTNSVLSFGDLGTPGKISIFGLGLFLPFVWALFNSKRAAQNESHSIFEGPSIPPWVWALVLIFLLFFRSYGLTTLPFWPTSDEGETAFFGWFQAQHWHWTFLWAQDRFEPFFIWSLGLFFRGMDPSLFSLRAIPLFFSLATCAAALWTARQFWSASFSFIFFVLFAFSFWVLTLSRTCLSLLPICLFQFICLGLFARVLKKPSPGSSGGEFLLLALLSGLGFYSWVAWGGMWLGMALILFLHFQDRGQRPFLHLLIFSLSGLLIALPLVLSRLGPGGADNIRNLAAFPLSLTTFHYVTGTLWNGSESFPYGSSWGGFFNPWVDSLLFLGAITVFRSLPRRSLTYGSILLLCASLPGIVTHTVDLNRWITLYPLLIVLAACGVSVLSSHTPKGLPRSLAILLLLTGPVVLDGYNYFFHYCDPDGIPLGHQWRSRQFFEAYRDLKTLSQQEGPLEIFTEFNTNYDDKTLWVCSYPFNASTNPSLEKGKPQWAALVTNRDFAPFFKKNFPGLRVLELPGEKKAPPEQKPFDVFVFPLSSLPPDRLEAWKRTERLLMDIDFEMKNKASTEPWSAFLVSHWAQLERWKGDPFLNTVILEKRAFFFVLDGRFKEAEKDYRTAVLKGIPVAHLYHNLALCDRFQGNIQQFELDSKMEKKVTAQ